MIVNLLTVLLLLCAGSKLQWCSCRAPKLRAVPESLDVEQVADIIAAQPLDEEREQGAFRTVWQLAGCPCRAEALAALQQGWIYTSSCLSFTHAIGEQLKE